MWQTYFYIAQRSEMNRWFRKVSMLERCEAVIVLQDILINFTGNSLRSFGLTKTREKDPYAQGYQLYIKGALNEACKQRIKQIAQDYNLTVKEDNGLIIYTPAC